MRTSRRVWLFLVAFLLFAEVGTPGGHAQSVPPIGQYYLAMGDSLAYGITAPGVPPDPNCLQPNAAGYVCRVFGYLKQVNPALQLNNLAIPEADSCVLVYGFGAGSPCVNSPATGVASSPLATAMQFIKAHPGQIGPVTVNVGGADLVPLLPAAVADPAGTAARLPKLFHTYQVNLDAALSQLRTALGPDTEIILLTQYNPLGGIGSPPLPPGLPAIANGAIGSLNQLMKGVAAKYNVLIADGAAIFDANPGGAALLTFVPTSLASGDPTKLDIYPNEQGYRLLGDTALKASGYRVAPFLKARLTHGVVKTGKSLSLSGTTISGASLTLIVSFPQTKAKKVRTAADNNGSFAVNFSSGKHVGPGKIRVCETDSIDGRSRCSTKRFRVR